MFNPLVWCKPRSTTFSISKVQKKNTVIVFSWRNGSDGGVEPDQEIFTHTILEPSYFPSERGGCEFEVSLRTLKRPGQPLWEALALDEALGGCEKLMKVWYLASGRVSCAQGRMQQLKDCNYSIMMEVDWIRAMATGWDQDRRPKNGHGLDIISLSWQLKTSTVNALLLLIHYSQNSRSGRCWRTGKKKQHFNH